MQRTPAPRSVALTPSPTKSSRSSELTVAASTSPAMACQFESCTQHRLTSYDFCNRHILQDHSAPFKQCAYVYNSTGKRCLGTAPKGEKRDGYCAEHSRKALAMRLRATRQKAQPETADTLLQSLNHYASLQSGKQINPFEEIDAARYNNSVARVLDLASDSDSEPCEGGAVTLDAAWSGDSETEGDSPDSDMEDPLRHALIYTEEEVVSQARDRLKRLQSLYTREFRSLQFRLREQRRFYLMSLKREKETMMSIHHQPKKTAEDIAAYRKLQALNHYHKAHGAEAVLHKKAKDRKAQALLVTPNNRQGHASRCSFTEGGVKCDDKALPLAKLCLRHILNDSQQLLFRACGVSRAELPPCQEPVLAVFSCTSCLCHKGFPQEAEDDPIISNFPNTQQADHESMEVDAQPITVKEEPLEEMKKETIEITSDANLLKNVQEQNSIPDSGRRTEDEGEISLLQTESEIMPVPDRRRKQDLSEKVVELPQESDSESVTLSANGSFNSDLIL